MERQTILWYCVRSVVFIVDGEWLTPVALAAEGSITQTVVDGAVTDAHILNFVDDGLYCIFHLHAGDETAVDSIACLGIHAFFPGFGVADDVFLERHHLTDGQVEVAGESKVAAIVGGDGHDGTCTVAGEDIFRNPDGDTLFCQRVDGVCSSKDTADLFDLGLTLTFGAVLGPGDVGLHFGVLLRGGYLLNQLMFRAENHKGDTEDGVRTSGENLETGSEIRIYLTHIKACGSVDRSGWYIEGEPYCCTLAAANPVALYFFQTISPIHLL